MSDTVTPDLTCLHHKVRVVGGKVLHQFWHVPDCSMYNAHHMGWDSFSWFVKDLPTAVGRELFITHPRGVCVCVQLLEEDVGQLLHLVAGEGTDLILVEMHHCGPSIGVLLHMDKTSVPLFL